MDKFQLRDLIWQYLSEKIDSYECWDHVKGFDNVVREYRKTILDDAAIPHMELYESNRNGFFILGEVTNGRFNGLGCKYYINSKKLYMGHFLDDTETGEGLYICANHTYYGSFLNNNYNGEGEIMTPTLYVRARFEKGDIDEVYNNSSAFDWNGKHYDENGKLEKGNSCLGYISIAFMILLAMGIYNYCSSWWKKYGGNDTEVATTPTAIGHATVTANVANLRTGPGTDYDFYMLSEGTKLQVTKGDNVEILEDAGDWFKVLTSDGGVAYIKKTLCTDMELYQQEEDDDPGCDAEEEVATVEEEIVDDGQAEDAEVQPTPDVNDSYSEAESTPSQVVEQPVLDEGVKDIVDQMPSFPGGGNALMQYLSNNVNYPRTAEENGIQGRVICTFVVEKDGSISDVRLAKSVDPSLDKEAIRVIKSMPRWIPGKQDGVPVRVKYTVPVTFRLQ